jgi:hypothetical protein
MKKNPLVGQTITKVWVAEDKGGIKFDLEGGQSVTARADGDCCSHTWIENVQGVEQIIGSPIVSVEDVDMPDLGSPDEYDVLAYYGCKITSGKGFALIDFRNESNGYYGGSLVWPSMDEDGYDYFYGGVHGQNVSKEDWREVS